MGSGPSVMSGNNWKRLSVIRDERRPNIPVAKKVSMVLMEKVCIARACTHARGFRGVRQPLCPLGDTCHRTHGWSHCTAHGCPAASTKPASRPARSLVRVHPRQKPGSQKHCSTARAPAVLVEALAHGT
jgi:hypothetical protein